MNLYFFSHDLSLLAFLIISRDCSQWLHTKSDYQFICHISFDDCRFLFLFFFTTIVLLIRQYPETEKINSWINLS